MDLIGLVWDELFFLLLDLELVMAMDYGLRLVQVETQ